MIPAMRVIEHPFSDLLRRPNEVVDDLADRDVLLRRRDAPALRLSLAARDDERADTYALVGRTLRNLAVHQPEAVSQAILDEFSWTTFLPDADRAEFVAELLRTVIAAGEVDNFAAVAQLLQEWRATAEIHSDPKLAARLAKPITGDGEPVPAPPS
jgi:hypothetical protein